MTWEQKFEAAKSLLVGNNAALYMRTPGNWYVLLPGVAMTNGYLLRSARGEGATPELAIEDLWRELTEEMQGSAYLVVNPDGPERRAVRWNGYMWMDIPERKRE